MKKVILTNGDSELTIVKSDVFRRLSDDLETVYVATERNIHDDTFKCSIVYDYLLEVFLAKYVLSSLAD